MEKIIKLINNPLFKSIAGDRILRIVRRPVSGRLGLNGLSRIVLKKSGVMPQEDEAYVFYLRYKDVVKVLFTDEMGQNILEFYGTRAKLMKAEILELNAIEEI